MPESGLHPALSTEQGFALISEAQSAQNLMRDAVAAISDMREPVVHSDAVFTLGSIGVEKTAKIFLGCASVEQQGAWPSLATMKGWGHDIDQVVDRLLTTAAERQRDAVANGYVSTLIERIQSSTFLPYLFATLSRYGRSGRFHYLDILATGSRSAFDAPAQYWDRLELEVAQGLGGAPAGGDAEFEVFLRRVSAAIAHELDVWWFVMHRLGVQGCFGELGKKCGWEIWPYGRADPLKR
nr:hypothetical protein [uncultured Microbacterium sp.]